MLNRFSRLIRRWYSEENSHLLAGLEGVKRDGTYAMMFTCKHCNTRSTKTFSKQSYHNGVVIVTCNGCAKHHLVADNLGWFFDKKKTIEDIMREQGKDVTKVDQLNEVIEFLKK